MTEGLKALLRAVAAVAVLPALLSLALRARLFGRDRAFQASTEWLALVPGLSGQYLRRAFLAAATRGCGPEAVIGTGTVFSSADVRIGRNAYIGPHCDIGWADIEEDVMIAAGTHVPSGADTHGTARVDLPMRDQAGTPRCVRIAEGAWIGNQAVVLADVGRHAIVGAGAVVTRPVPDYAVALGVPAKVVRDRRTAPAAADQS